MEIAVILSNQCRRRVAQMSLPRTFNSEIYTRGFSMNHENAASQTERLDADLVRPLR